MPLQKWLNPIVLYVCGDDLSLLTYYLPMWPKLYFDGTCNKYQVRCTVQCTPNQNSEIENKWVIELVAVIHNHTYYVQPSNLSWGPFKFCNSILHFLWSKVDFHVLDCLMELRVKVMPSNFKSYATYANCKAS